MTKKPEKIEPVRGWLLICREEVFNDEDLSKPKFGPRWYIGWHEPFGTKKAALAFAKSNKWYAPYKAVRGELRAD